MLMEEEVDEVGGCEQGTPAASPVPSLPDEMVFEILLRLPAKNLHRCNCVSKGWRTLIGSLAFIQAYKDRHPGVGLLITVSDLATFTDLSHYQYSPIGFRPQRQPVLRLPIPKFNYGFEGVTEVVNGLLCFFNQKELFVCNIFTGKVRPLPHPGNSPIRQYFFGFDVVNGVYKLLGVKSHSIEILTLGIGSDCCWRTVCDGFETGVKRARYYPLRRICVDGVMYWMVVKLLAHRKGRCYLCSFDLNKEKFRYLKIPRGLTAKCLLSHFFAKFRGRLALSVPTYRGGYRLSVHVLEDDESNTWTKHSIPLPEALDQGQGVLTIPVGNLPDGQILLLNPVLGEVSSTAVYAYDHQTCKFERLCVGRFPIFNWEHIQEDAAVMISCVQENLIASDVLFN